MRKCKDCQIERSDEDFPSKPDRRTKSGFYKSGTCTECWNAQYRTRSKKYHAQNREKICARMRDRYEAHKAAVLEHYGDECVCCGIKGDLFLTIDHINNDGHLHRKTPGATSHHNIYGWLVRRGFPTGFQVLCMNCNHAKHRNKGICPHKTLEGSTIIPEGSRGRRLEMQSAPRGR